MSESHVPTDITCPSCRQKVTGADAAGGVLACPSCATSFVASGSREVTLQLRSAGGGGRNAGAVNLPPEFRARYELGQLLGRGGMGTVFRARDLKSGQDVAVKVLMQIESDQLLARFLQEGKLALDIDHPNVMKVYEIAELAGHPYMVSEVLPGGSLRDRIRAAQGPLPLEDSLRITTDVVNGLSAVHARGIIHRDIKPDNVLFAADGTAKLVDFGIAKDQSSMHRMTQTGELLGTPQYMAPEQIRGQTVTRQTDFYSVGVILYEMLTGRPPFLGKDVFELMAAHVSGRYPSPDLLVPGMPDEVLAIVQRALNKEPARRPSDAEQFAMALRLSPREMRQTTRVRALTPEALAALAAEATANGEAAPAPGAEETPASEEQPPLAPDRRPLLMILLLCIAMGATGVCQHVMRTRAEAPASAPLPAR